MKTCKHVHISYSMNNYDFHSKNSSCKYTFCSKNIWRILLKHILYYLFADYLVIDLRMFVHYNVAWIHSHTFQIVMVFNWFWPMHCVVMIFIVSLINVTQIYNSFINICTCSSVNIRPRLAPVIAKKTHATAILNWEENKKS